MTQSLRSLCLSIMSVLIIGASAPATAQDFGIGYQFFHASSEGESTNLPAGFGVDASVPLTPAASIFGFFDVAHKTETDSSLGAELKGTLNLIGYGAGVRWKHQPAGGALGFYVHGAAGATTARAKFEFMGDEESDSDTKLMIEGGAGVWHPITPVWSLFGEVDFRLINTESSIKGVRVFAGGRISSR